MRERLFFLTALPLALGATVCGFLVRVPHPVPDYALQAPPVYRAEVGLAVFATGYLVAICLRLAWHGRTFTRLGSTLEVPDVNVRLNDQMAAMSTSIAELDAARGRDHLRLQRLEGRSNLHAVDDDPNPL